MYKHKFNGLLIVMLFLEYRNTENEDCQINAFNWITSSELYFSIAWIQLDIKNISE